MADKISIQTAIAARQVLLEVDQQLPLNTSVALARAQRSLEEWTEPFYEKYNDTIRKHLPEGETTLNNESENWEEFMQELEPILEEEFQLGMEPLVIDALPGLELTPSDVFILQEAGILAS